MTTDWKSFPRHTFGAHQGALTQVPLFEPSYGGVNWFAKIYRTSNGKLDRYFAPRSHGQFYYRLEPWVVPGTPVEFGADGRQRRRWYGVVVAVTPTQITLVECSTSTTDRSWATTPTPS
jgi:hypothetical protein